VNELLFAFFLNELRDFRGCADLIKAIFGKSIAE
jgi:hypothetical protein